MPDYLPSTDLGLLAWGDNFASLITADPATYGLIAGDATVIQDAFDAYETALQLALDPPTRTPVAIASKNQARTFFEQTARPYAQQIKLNQSVQLEDKVALGLNFPDADPITVPVPTSAPILAVIGATFGVHTLRFADENHPASRRKPIGASALLLYRNVAEEVDPEQESAVFVGAFTKNPVASSFGTPDNGMVATYFARWMNSKGEVGPWSAPVHFTIVS